MIRCIALDDEPFALEILREFCNQVSFLQLEQTFTQPSQAANYLETNPVDLIFLDIQMPNISGIDFYKSLANPPLVIFTTAYSEYAVEGFNLNALDFLLKPYTQTRFIQAAHKANEFHKFTQQTDQQEIKHIFVRSEYSLIKINLTDILYIETLDDYIKIHCFAKKPILTLMTMKGITEKLPINEFVRIHRSFVVAIKRIEAVRGKFIDIGVTQLPIGQKYEQEFFKTYTSEGFY